MQSGSAKKYERRNNLTYRKIAQLAGVSLSTVSKALSGSSEISDATAERIRRIAEENGAVRPKYRKNHPSLRVAIIVPEIISVYYSEIVTCFIDEFRRFGIEPFIHICGFDRDKSKQLYETLADEQLADGIVMLCEYDMPTRLDIPNVYMCKGKSGSDSINCDYDSALFEAVEYLKALGHKNIGFMGEINTVQKERMFASVAGRLDISVPEKYLFRSDKRFADIGREAAEYFMSLDDMPTAFLAAYDEIALGAIHTFKISGIRVPEDVSIIGINDIPSASYASVPLTTIRTYQNEMIKLAVKLLLEAIETPEKHMVQNILVKGELIIRDTTAKALCKSKTETTQETKKEKQS